MKTYMANPAKVEKKWYVVDAEGQTLGRLASEVAKVLRGKNKPEFTPFVDTGDYVIVINAEKIVVSGKKMEQKLYHTHSAYVGGFKTATLKEMIEKKPEKVVELCFQRDRWAERCTQSFTYMQEQSIRTQHRSQKY